MGHFRLKVVLVHRGDVVELVFTFAEHAAKPVLNDHRQFVRIRGVIADAIGDGAGQCVTVAILVLQALAVQRGATGGCTNQETPRLAVARRPSKVADALEAKHGVEDVKRHHGVVAGAVGRGRCEPGRKGAGFVDALLQDLAFLVFLVIHDLAGVVWRVLLPHRGVDAQLPEHTLHSEGPCLVGHNGNDALTDRFVFHQR